MASFLRTRHFPARQDRAIGVRASGHLVSWSGLVPSRKLGNSPTFKLLIGLVTRQKQQKAGKSKQMSKASPNWLSCEGIAKMFGVDILRIVGALLEKDAAPCLTLLIHIAYPISDTMEGTLRRMTTMGARELTCSKLNCYGLDQN